jgi:tryptophan synthase beta chain
MSTGARQTPSFHEQMEHLLLEQLKTHPRNHAARLKLLELYFEAERTGPFLRHAEELAGYTPDKATSPEWQKALSMGRMLAPESPLFSAHGTDRLEFVGAGFSSPAPAQEKAQVRRLGDDERFTRHFQDLATAFEASRGDPPFQAMLDMELTYLARRPSSLLHARRLSQKLGGAQIYLKREDASPRDTQLIISVVGQALLAQRLGRKILVTSTIDGRRGVVTASIAARLGLEAVVFMDQDRNSRHSSNVFRMWLLGANLMPAGQERGEAPDVRESALKYWARNAANSMMIFGLEGAPEPYPSMAREFASSIGRECLRQVRIQARRAPDLVVARGGANSDALGLLPPMVPDRNIRLACVEPAAPDAQQGATDDPTRPGLSADKQRVAHSILEGMEYPSVGREHRWLRESGRVEYIKASLDAAKEAIRNLSYYEGITPAIGTAHALGWACQEAAAMKPEQAVVVMVAEEVEKDIWDIGRLMGAPL